MAIIQIKRGPKANLPVLNHGEFAWCWDEEELFIGTPNGNYMLYPSDGTGNPHITVTDSLINGNIIVNGVEVTVFDSTALTNAIAGKASISHGHVFADIPGLQTTLDGKALIDHVHFISSIPGLQTELDDKASLDHNHPISGIPGLQAALDSKALTGHEHTINQVADLQDTLDGKSDVGHIHPELHTHGNIAMLDRIGISVNDNLTVDGVEKTGGSGGEGGAAIDDGVVSTVSTWSSDKITDELAEKAETDHDHIVADVTGLQGALDLKSNIGHVHTMNEIPGLQGELDGKAASGHIHTIGNVTGLQPALDGKSPTGHTHTELHTHANKVSLDRININGSDNLTIDGVEYIGGGGGGPTALSDLTDVDIPGGTASDGDILIYQDGAWSAAVVPSLSGLMTEPISDSEPIELEDIFPPDPPSDIQVFDLSDTTLTLGWTASPSPDAASYDIHQDGVLITNTTDLTYDVTGLVQLTAYTFKIFAKDAEGNRSVEATRSVTTRSSDMTPPVVTASPTGGTFGEETDVMLSANEAATIRYTIDGSLPSEASPIYSTPISISEGTVILRFYAKDPTGNISTFGTETYTIGDLQDPVVTILPAGSAFTGSKEITLIADESANIYYTLDGSTPTPASTLYTGPFTITQTRTVIAMGVDTAGNEGNPVSETYTASDTTAPTVTALPNGGNFGITQVVQLSANETANIYYTLDGTTPTTAHTLYTEPFTISATTTVKFIGVDAASNTSVASSVVFTKMSEVQFPGFVYADTTSTSLKAIWTLPTGTAPTSYELYKDGVLISNPTIETVSTTRRHVLTGLTPGTMYTVKIVAVYAGGIKTAGLEVRSLTHLTTVPTTDVLDTFTRPNIKNIIGISDSGHRWEPHASLSVMNNMEIFNNTVKNMGGSQSAYGALVTTNTKSTGILIEGEVLDYGGLSTSGVVFRQNAAIETGGGNRWLFVKEGGAYKVIKYVSNVATVVVQRTIPQTAPDTFGVELRGSRIICYLNGVQVFDIVDTQWVNEIYHGLYLYNTTTHAWDNFKITDVSALPAPALDTTPPTEVTNVTVSATNSTTIKVDWKTVQNNSVEGPYAFEVWVDGVFYSTVPNTATAVAQPPITTNVTGRTSGQTYTVTVKAKDGVGNMTTGVSASSITMP